MNSKTTFILTITALITTIIPLTACEQEPLPDLIIESVTCYDPGEYDAEQMSLVYILGIRNIGNAPAGGQLYVSGMRQTSLVKSTESVIEPGEIFACKIIDHIRYDEIKVSFSVNPEIDIPHMASEGDVQYYTHTEYDYRIEESNYKNNAYELEIPWDIPRYVSPAEDEVTITKYVTTNTQYLVTGEPVKYTFEEIEQVIEYSINRDPRDNLSEEALQCCLYKILDYIYAFPGYEYEEITCYASCPSTTRIGANLLIHVDCFGLSSATIATSSGQRYGDTCDLYLRYDGDTCELGKYSSSIFHRIVPKEIYDNAVLLAMEHPVVQDFIEDAGGPYSEISDQGYSLRYHTWIDDFYCSASYYRDYVYIINRIDFQSPVEGVVVFEFTDTERNSLWVYVDMFNGEIFARGPIYNPPEDEHSDCGA